MKFSAVFLTTLAGSALANPVAVPNADNSVKRAELDIRALDTSLVSLSDVGGALTSVTGGGVGGVPGNLGTNVVTGADLQTLITTVLDSLVVSVCQLVQKVVGALGSLPNAPSAPTLPACPVNVGTIAPGPALSSVSSGQLGAVVGAATTQAKTLASINNIIPKNSITGALSLTQAQSQIYAPKAQAIQSDLVALLSYLQALNTSGTIGGTGATVPSVDPLTTLLGLIGGVLSLLPLGILGGLSGVTGGVTGGI